MAQWIRHRPTEPGIAGSSPAGVIMLECWHPCNARSPSHQVLTVGPRAIARAAAVPRSTRHRLRCHVGYLLNKG